MRVERTDRADAAAAVARIFGERGRVRLVMPADFPVNFASDGFDLVPDENFDRAAIARADGVITVRACAIAQTGTIVLNHGAGQGRQP